MSYITGAVEGILDEAVLRRLTLQFGIQCEPIYGKEGKGRLLRQLGAYNNAARFSPWCVLIDLDRDADCAPSYLTSILPHPVPGMIVRVAVREVESWLLADHRNISRFLGIRQASVPPRPDELDHPKRVVVDLARRSRYRNINIELVPRPNSGRSEGSAYTSRMIEFVNERWDPNAAAERSPSLARCLRALDELRSTLTRE